jgi:hypothetical protein
VDHARGHLRWIALALGLLLTTCGGDNGPECVKPADCVGRPGGNYCKMIAGKAHCVTECLPAADGKDNCPPTYSCSGHADDGSLYCKA